MSLVVGYPESLHAKPTRFPEKHIKGEIAILRTWEENALELDISQKPKNPSNIFLKKKLM